MGGRGGRTCAQSIFSPVRRSTATSFRLCSLSFQLGRRRFAQRIRLVPVAFMRTPNAASSAAGPPAVDLIDATRERE